MHLLYRFLLLPIYLALLVQCLPVDVELLPRAGGSGFCPAFPLPIPSVPEGAHLPPIDVPITRNIQTNVRSLETLPWTVGVNTPGHDWRWRAATVNGYPILQIQARGHFRVRAELQTNAPYVPAVGPYRGRPAVPAQPAIRRRSDPAISDGAGSVNGGWGQPASICIFAEQREDVTYILHVTISNIPR
ncbi:hypothetical protein TUN199_11545 [Pyrenophora tritici-repentis]|nr:hypothetical protein PtrV1_07043 [Pyrenophora tritici-repentis]KAF7448094.1 hypothetical protein A1F99_074580 [Pyrenophora tritici-repentis]KAI0569352.1 hypothetical protein Alg215_11688 [Pyrenophora tritici-repentis]KAI0569382.1 hypothetical protein Alg130_11669 [Pyrenophora tritici-repentis]KAI0604302.1 hypothetical protein TUN205_11450 [Pyrenophora tritici-repentis]